MRKGVLVPDKKPAQLLTILSDEVPHHAIDLKAALALTSDNALHTTIRKLRLQGHNVQTSTVYWLETEEC